MNNIMNTVAHRCIHASDAEDSADEDAQLGDNDQAEENELSGDNDQSGKVKFNCHFIIQFNLGSQWVMCSIKQLLQLANGKCREQECSCSREVCCEVTGNCVEINATCRNGHRFYWSSSKFHINKNQSKIFDINLLLASGIILSGNSYTKIRVLFDFMQLAIISPTTFYRYQCHFICPTVKKYYTDEQVCKSHAQ